MGRLLGSGPFAPAPLTPDVWRRRSFLEKQNKTLPFFRVPCESTRQALRRNQIPFRFGRSADAGHHGLPVLQRLGTLRQLRRQRGAHDQDRKTEDQEGSPLPCL